MAIDHGELRLLLTSLSHELCRPLVSLRAGFDLLLQDTGTLKVDQRGHLLTMLSLCDDLLRLTPATSTTPGSSTVLASPATEPSLSGP